MQLSVGHGAGIEPNVNEVSLAAHGSTGGRNEHNLIDVGAVQVNAVIVLSAVVSGHKTFLLQRIRFHESALHALFDFCIELFQRGDAHFLFRVGVAPDGQRRSPVAGTAEVPVVEVFKPFAEASRSGGSRFPLNLFVQFHHALFEGRTADEPTVKRIVEHRFVGTPAVRIVVDVFLNLESLALLLEFHAKDDVEVLCFLGCFFVIFSSLIELGCIGVLDEGTGVVSVEFFIHAGLEEGGSEFFDEIVFSGQINHGARLAGLIDEEERGDAGGFRHLGVVRTESRGDVYDARTVFRGDIVARDNSEGSLGEFDETVVAHAETFLGMRLGKVHGFGGTLVREFLAGFHPRHEGFVVHANEFTAFPRADDLIRHDFIALLIRLKICIFSFLVEVGVHKNGSHDGSHGLSRVGIESAEGDVVNGRTDAKCGVGGQGPRSRGPSEEEGIAPPLHLGFRIDDAELRRHGGVLHITVAAGLIEFVATESGTCGGRIGLNGVAFVEQPLFIELSEQPPDGFDVGVVVGDVGVLHIYPVAHLTAEFRPLLGIFHHVATAVRIVVSDGNVLSDVFFRDVQFFFHAKFDGQSVRVPSCFSFHLKTLHGFVAAESIFE